jgi:hypothetical protein
VRWTSQRNFSPSYSFLGMFFHYVSHLSLWEGVRVLERGAEISDRGYRSFRVSSRIRYTSSTPLPFPSSAPSVVQCSILVGTKTPKYVHQMVNDRHSQAVLLDPPFETKPSLLANDGESIMLWHKLIKSVRRSRIGSNTLLSVCRRLFLRFPDGFLFASCFDYLESIRPGNL